MSYNCYKCSVDVNQFSNETIFLDTAYLYIIGHRATEVLLNYIAVE